MNWTLGQYVRVWRNEGYEYGHIETIETIEDNWRKAFESVLECVVEGREPGPKRWQRLIDIFTGRGDVMLVGDDGKEIYCRVKDLESGWP